MDRSEFQKILKEINVELTDNQCDQFDKYYEMLIETNKVMNLTSITEYDEVIIKHFIDSLLVVNIFDINQSKKMIDVGTGAGFPGIPIAIMDEDKKITLLDSLNKRINFLNLVINELGLKNVKTIHSRAEDGAKTKELREKFDIATSRAVANMAVLSEFCLPYVKVGGSFVSLKGPAIEEELEGSRNAIGVLGGKLKNIIEVEIEGTDLNHNIVIVNKIKECPSNYPRKAGVVSKKPIK